MAIAPILITALALLMAAAIGMAALSLFWPRVSLFFAHAAKRTRLWGVGLWMLIALFLFEIHGLAKDAMQGKPSPAVSYMLAFLLAAICLQAIYRLRKPHLGGDASPDNADSKSVKATASPAAKKKKKKP